MELLLWGGLAVAPLLAIGVLEYLHSLRTVRALIASQLEIPFERAENAETLRLFDAQGAGDPQAVAGAREVAQAYLDQAWELFRSSYLWIELPDSADGRLLRLGSDPGPFGAGSPGPSAGDRARVLHQPVLDPGDGREVGPVVALTFPGAILPWQEAIGGWDRPGVFVPSCLSGP